MFGWWDKVECDVVDGHPLGRVGGGALRPERGMGRVDVGEGEGGK